MVKRNFKNIRKDPKSWIIQEYKSEDTFNTHSWQRNKSRIRYVYLYLFCSIAGFRFLKKFGCHFFIFLCPKWEGQKNHLPSGSCIEKKNITWNFGWNSLPGNEETYPTKPGKKPEGSSTQKCLCASGICDPFQDSSWTYLFNNGKTISSIHQTKPPNEIQWDVSPTQRLPTKKHPP